MFALSIHLSMILRAKVLTLSKKSNMQNFGFVILLIENLVCESRRICILNEDQ